MVGKLGNASPPPQGTTSLPPPAPKKPEKAAAPEPIPLAAVDGPLSENESKAISAQGQPALAREKTTTGEDIIDFLVGIFTLGQVDTRFFQGKVDDKVWDSRGPMLVEAGGARLKHALFAPGVTEAQATDRLVDLILRTNPGMPKDEAQNAAKALLPSMKRMYDDPRLDDTRLDALQGTLLRDRAAFVQDAGQFLATQTAPKPPPAKNATDLEAQMVLNSSSFAKLDSSTRQKIAQLCFTKPELVEVYKNLPGSMDSLPVGARQALLLSVAKHPNPAEAMTKISSCAISDLSASLRGQICEGLSEAMTDPARFDGMIEVLHASAFTTTLNASLQSRAFDGSLDGKQLKRLADSLRSGAFSGLDAATQAKLFPLAAEWTENQAKGFASLSPEARTQILALPAALRDDVVAKLGSHAIDTDAAQQIAQIVLSPGFQKLDAAAQKKMLLYVGGTSHLSNEARGALIETMADAKKWPADAAKQKDALAAWMKNNDGAPGGLGFAPKPGIPEYAPSTKVGPIEVKGYAFEAGKADALKYEVTINGHKVDVYLPKDPDPEHAKPDIDHVIQGLAGLPSASFALIKQVRVNPKPNSQDPHWAIVYKRPGFHSYMTAGSAGTVDIYPNLKGSPLGAQLQLENSMVHETGHILSQKAFGANDKGPGWKKWHDAIRKDGIVPSQYAKSAPAEDFSEFLTLYTSVKGTPAEKELRELMPERCKVYDEITAKKD